MQSCTENFLALTVAILADCTPEAAFDRLINGAPTGIRPHRTDITKEDVEDMARLKEQGETFGAIGDMYGIKGSTVYIRIKRYKERRGLA